MTRNLKLLVNIVIPSVYTTLTEITWSIFGPVVVKLDRIKKKYKILWEELP